MIPSTRRLLFSLAATLLLAAPMTAAAQDRIGNHDISLGAANAPITVIEYASVTCPHCAKFNAEVFPVLKARYIDTGKVRYVFREVPIHEQEDAAGFLIARCSGQDKYLAVTDTLFRNQPLLFDKHNLYGWLLAGARAGGLDEVQMKACISDAKALEDFNARAEHTATVDKIDSTPTVIVNGKRVEVKGPEFAFSDLDAAIQPLLPARTPRRAKRHA